MHPQPPTPQPTATLKRELSPFESAWIRSEIRPTPFPGKALSGVSILPYESISISYYIPSAMAIHHLLLMDTAQEKNNRNARIAHFLETSLTAIKPCLCCLLIENSILFFVIPKKASHHTCSRKLDKDNQAKFNRQKT